MAKETVAICNAGYYVTPSGARMEIGEMLNRAKAGTILYSPANPPQVHPSSKMQTKLIVRNETTFAAVARLAASGEHVACLNLASAKNPGGGFLNGSLAQEEALACASGLYPCLMHAPEFYERNRANRSAIYLDLAIFSPNVPFFRHDNGALLEKLVLASVITSPAPNAGAVAQNERENVRYVQPAFRRRSEQVLAIAGAHKVNRLVLGAWGCGVFRNDPRFVARTFAELLKPPGKFAGQFTEVVFAVFDRSFGSPIFKAFAEQLDGG